MKKIILLLLLLSNFSIQSNDFDTIYTEAKKYLEQNDFNNAIKLYKSALEIKPNDLKSNFYLGYSYQTLGNLEKAVETYKKILEFYPNYISVQSNLAHALRHLGIIDEALYHYEKSIKMRPENASLRYGYAETLLKLGDFKKGWEEFEYRYKRNETGKRFELNMWDGSSNIDGKRILIRAEYGLGDTIQFIRFAKYLKEMGAYVIAEAHGALIKILSYCPYIDEIISINKTIPFDIQVPVMSLPYKLNITNEKPLLTEIPYLFSDEKLSTYWKSELSRNGNFKIGICWEGSTYYDSLRSSRSKKAMHLSEFEPLSEIPNITFYSLQKSDASKHINEVSFEVIDFGPDFDESHGRFMDTAALIENLDLIITVDTSVAHLAGAMGKQVWVILPSVADWRWMEERNDTPWYSTMKLFRQKEYGTWNSLFKKIKENLSDLLEKQQKKGDIVSAEISIGELIDKITILQLKMKYIKNETKLKNIKKELTVLCKTRDTHVNKSEKLDKLTKQLYNANQKLWDIEDACRDKERIKEFDNEFIKITRSVYINNDERCALKRKINLLLGSNLIEEKSYAAY